MKKRFFMLFVAFSVLLVQAIEKKDYESMTEHDRIVIAVSYYEVGTAYKNKGKDDIAKSYLREAYSIEKDVEKYANGELEIPEKTINFNWDEIFTDENEENTSEDDSVTTDVVDDSSSEEAGTENTATVDSKNNTEVILVSDDSKENSSDIQTKTPVDEENIATVVIADEDKNSATITPETTIQSFMLALSELDWELVATFFNSSVSLIPDDILMTNEEIIQTLKEWINIETNQLPTYTVTKVDDNIVKVTFSQTEGSQPLLLQDDFGNTWFGFEIKDEKLLISTISYEEIK